MARLFGELGVVAYELAGPGDLSMLLPAERAATETFVDGRKLQYAAGRSCARAGLADLGFDARPLLSGHDRRPLWPAGAEGSISHTDGFCVAISARTSELAGRGIGVDTEQHGRVRPELFAKLFTASELSALEDRAPTDRALAATIMFSAKEAFYKAQYPRSEAWVSFTDVEIELPMPAAGGCAGRAHRATELAALDLVRWPVAVGVDVRPGVVITAVVVEPA